ncbi:MAG: hypothetical protein CSA26_03315 [Desulfobacterales bacterium]|nr:MAG: hypothetical protein CSA26_03315 [Desulfobacterales bacterium]
MANPIVSLPLLTTNPVGWAVLGTAGYLTYRAGKKAAMKTEEQTDQPGFCDRAVKGAMKAAYRTKMKVDESLSSTRKKYSGMWDEAQSEVDNNA